MITADMITKLRDETGAGIWECKRALLLAELELAFEGPISAEDLVGIVRKVVKYLGRQGEHDPLRSAARRALKGG